MKRGTKAQRHEGTKGNARSRFFLPLCLRAFVPFCLLLLATGCSYESKSDPPPMTLREKQEAALKDPMNYKPEEEKPYDISGGGINNLDKKALKRDLDHALDP
jgi:hypothetical protein